MFSPRFSLDDQHPLVDEPVQFTVVGLQPGERVRISAECTDHQGARFASWAEYDVGAAGVAEPGRQAPVAGSYSGADPYGLWWSMTSEAGEPFSLGLEPVPTSLWATRRGDRIAQALISRIRLMAGVDMKVVRESGLVATLFSPVSAPGPPVVVVGGSGGGLNGSLEMAALLGSRGFTAMAVAYFGVEGLPTSLAEVPVEYFGKAIRWLRAEVSRGGRIGASQVGVIGASRGGELALLIGAAFPDVGAVVASAPSGIAWEGFHPASVEPVPAWTRGGSPVPFATLDRPLARAAAATNPVNLRDAYLHSLADSGVVARTTIPVEDINGPVLLISGDDDLMWPSGPLSEIAMQRLGTLGHAFDDQHLRYPGAGHVVGRPPGLPTCEALAKHPVDGRLYALGGTPEVNAAASADAWPRVLDFLRLNLAQGARPNRLGV